MTRWQAVATALCVFLCAQVLSAQTSQNHHSQRGPVPSILATHGRPSLVFEANHGQTDPSVAYLLRSPGFTLFLTKQGPVVASSNHCEKVAGVLRKVSAAEKRRKTPQPQTNCISRTNWVRLHLVGAGAASELFPGDELPGKVNYFVGSDPTKWHGSIPTSRKVVQHNIYPGIDLVYHLDANTIEFDFQLAPDADPNAIRLELETSEPQHLSSARVRLTPSGDLALSLGDGELRVRKPKAFQLTGGRLQPVLGDFALVTKNTLRFRVGPYDTRRALVIDPVLSYSTYLGGEANDGASALAIDSVGNAYITGFTQSVAFPVLNPPSNIANAGQLDAGSQDVFVTQLAPGDASLVYSTYLGGSALDQATGIAVDSSGNAYVAGFTQSADFPLVNPLPAPNNALQGMQNAFVVEIAAGGSNLVYSTYLGGSQSDQANAIAVDSAGNSYVAGSTQSANFPEFNGFQTAIAGGNDGFVSEIQSGGGALLYSTFLGGMADDFLDALALAPGPGTILYVAGQTQSTNFPTTTGVLQPSCALDVSGQCNDAFVAAINPTNQGPSSLVFSTFLGGTHMDLASAIAADSGGIYVAGSTASSDFPLVRPEQGSFAGGTTDAFVAKLQTDGTGLLYSTFLGGSSSDSAMGVAIDASGNAYISGTTMSSDFPAFNPLAAPNNTFQGSAGNGDAFLAKLNKAGSALIVSTFLGGTGNDQANAVVVDNSGNAYLAGTTSSQDMPTANASQPANAGPGGTSDAFIAEVSQLAQPVANLSLSNLSFGDQLVGATSAPQNVTFSNFGDAALNVSSITTNGDYQTTGCPGLIPAGGTCQLSITFTPATTGDRPGTVTITDNATGSPRVINLDGTGIAPVVAVSPTSLTFGSQNVDTTSAAQNVTLTNSGSGPLTISGITASSNFVQTSNCPAMLSASSSCTIQVNFSPSTTGSFSGSVTITDNASSSPQSVSLSGSGTKQVTSTLLSASPNPSLLRQAVTFTVQVAGQYGGTPTGSVTFKQSSLILKVVTLVNGQAVYTTSYSTAGVNSITAIYSGDVNFLGSTSATLKQVVNKVPTTTSVTSSQNPSTFGQAVTLTATVVSGDTGLALPSPTGAVTFLQGVATLGTGTLSGGVATLTTGSLAVGTLSITARYGGDANYLGSNSPKLSPVVNQANTTTVLSSSSNPSVAGQAVTFTAIVSANGPSVSGTVTFKLGTTTLATTPITNGVAAYTTSLLPVGSDLIAATYNGATDFTKSSGSITQTIYVSTSCIQELVTGFEGGVNGNTVDPTTLGNNTFGYQIGSWALVGTITWSNTVSQGLQAPTAVLCGPNQSYPADNSALSLVETGVGSSVANDVNYKWSDTLSTLAASVWFYSDRSSSDGNTMDIFSIFSTGSDDIGFTFNSAGGKLSLAVESPGGSTRCVTYTPNTWVNLQLQFNKNSANHVGAVYDANGNQLCSQTEPSAQNASPNKVLIGHQSAHVLAPGKHDFWDSLQIFYDPVTFPGLPQ
jgi:Bacterial Ig-like domain (group 3)/Beta-propeller repeat/Protein of unknown function (DUF1573)